LNKGYGAPPHGLPSWFDEAGVDAQAEWLGTIASHYAGRGYDYTLGIGLHFELKYGAWTGYESAAVESYATWLDGDKADPNLLLAGWGAAAEREVPGVERLGGVLDASTASWIAFREDRARAVVDRLTRLIRSHDPSATVSAPLGEGFRTESAEFGNQDIVG